MIRAALTASEGCDWTTARRRFRYVQNGAGTSAREFSSAWERSSSESQDVMPKVGFMSSNSEKAATLVEKMTRRTMKSDTYFSLSFFMDIHPVSQGEMPGTCE